MKILNCVIAASLLTTLIGLAACDNETASGATAPAHVDNPVAETELTTISLTPEAVSRLGVKATAVERRMVTMTRTLGGVLLTPPGHAMTVFAPSAGIVQGPGREAMLSAGSRLDAGSVVMELLLLPLGSDLLTAREDVPVLEAEYAVAMVRAERAEQLLSGRSGSQEQLEQAQAELVRAESALRVARSRVAMLLGAEAPALTPISMVAPEGGVLTALHVASGQVVSGSAALFDVQVQDRLWVRVPIYSADLDTIHDEAPARIAPLGEWAGAQGRTAQRIAGPPTANTDAVSVDFYYELDNSDGSFRSGERVQVTVILGDSGEHLVVPWSAIFRDIEGGAWVYEQTAPGIYVRTRVSVQRVMDDVAVLSRGPAAGSMVVTTAVAELAGTEFGVAH